MLGRYCGRRVIHGLAERARAEPYPRQRRALYQEVEEIIARESLLLLLFVSEDGLLLETWATGRHTLRYLLDSGDTRDVAVDLPSEPGGVVRIEKPDLPPASPKPRVTLVHADGSPAMIHTSDVFYAAPWIHDEDRDGMTGLPGASFRVRATHPEDGYGVMRYGRLEGAGPWTVRLGSAALRVTLTLEDEELWDRALYVDGEVFRLERGGTTAVTGLLAGPHTLLMGADGHVGRAMRVVLREAETRGDPRPAAAALTPDPWASGPSRDKSRSACGARAVQRIAPAPQAMGVPCLCNSKGVSSALLGGLAAVRLSK